MHDLKRLRDNSDDLRKSIERKGFTPQIARALEFDRRFRRLTSEINELRAELNSTSKAVGKAKREGRDAKEDIQRAKLLGEQISAMNEGQKSVQKRLKAELMQWPAEPDSIVPDGIDEKDNVIIRTKYNFEQPDFKPVEHVALAEHLGILDMQRGSKITGTAFPVYVGKGANLERALINYMLDTHNNLNGYKEIFPPFLVNEASVWGTGQLPKLQGDMYMCEKDNYYLIPTAEVPITNMHRDELIQENDLPIKYVAYSACFRREAGAYGADTRGLLRVHQFNKVELVRIVHPDVSERAHEEILEEATKILDALQITYRIVELCTGELSFTASRCYDIEVWAPGTQTWLEASSVSNFRDFQSRRMNLRFKPEKGGKPIFPHTLNGSALATSRVMVAILESYQTPEKRVRIPKVLQPYMGGIDQITGNE